jgi:hypothetical protein
MDTVLVSAILSLPSWELSTLLPHSSFIDWGLAPGDSPACHLATVLQQGDITFFFFPSFLHLAGQYGG